MSETFDAQWLMEQDFDPIRYVVEGIIPEGMSLLVAAPKIGKSWMVLGLGLALSNGGEAFGCLPVGESRPVLYLALEDGKRRLQARLLMLRPTTVSSRLEFQTSVAPGSVIATIRDYLTEHADQAPVVILDTLGKVMPQSGSGSQYAHDYGILSALKATTDAVPGSSLVIVHHTRKSEGVDFLDAVSGTQGIAGAADTVLVLKRDRHEQQATLHVTSRDAAEGEYSLSLEGGTWTLAGGGLGAAAQAAQTSKLTAGVGDRMVDVIETINGHPEGLKPHDLAALLGLDDKSAQVYLSRAFEAGRIGRPRRGLYTPVGSVGLLVPPPAPAVGSSLNHTQQPHTTNTYIERVGERKTEGREKDEPDDAPPFSRFANSGNAPVAEKHLLCTVCGNVLHSEPSQLVGVCRRGDTAHVAARAEVH